MKIISVILFVVVFEVSCRAGAQVVSFETARKHPDILTSLPSVDLSSAEKAHASQSNPPEEEDRAKRYDHPSLPPLFNAHNFSKSDEVTTVTFAHGGPGALPTEASDIIVIGEVERSVPHLSKSGSSVYSTFCFSPTMLLKGSLNSLNLPITLERAGGVVLYPSGKRAFIGTAERGIPVPGFRYLLFLKATRSKDEYIILGGYSIGSSHVLALDDVGKPFEGLTDIELVNRVKEKIAER